MSDLPDLEERLRAAVGRRSDAFEPSAELPARIEARVRRQRRRRRLVQGGLVSAAAAVLAVVAFVGLDGDDAPIRTDDDVSTRPPATSTPSPTSRPSSTAPSSTSTTASTTTPTTTTAFDPGPGPGGLDVLTNLHRRGIGPIVAGMTVREAQAASGVALAPVPVGDGSCLEASLDLGGTVLVIEAVGGDPMDGIVRATAGGVIPSDDGPMVGQTRAELLAGVGPPTRTEAGPPDLGGELLVFEEGGYAYGALVVDDLLLGLQTGDPAWVTDIDGCPG